MLRTCNLARSDLLPDIASSHFNQSNSSDPLYYINQSASKQLELVLTTTSYAILFIYSQYHSVLSQEVMIPDGRSYRKKTLDSAVNSPETPLSLFLIFETEECSVFCVCHRFLGVRLGRGPRRDTRGARIPQKF